MTADRLPQGVRVPLPQNLDAEFTALVERQSRFVFRVAYAVLLNSHDAEDAVQETFMKLYRNHGWQQANNERAFLARAAWRVSVDLRAKAGNRFSQSSETNLENLDLPSLIPDPEQILESSRRHALVHALIDALPEELRLPLVLSTGDELNSREIADVLSLPEGTVRTRLMRARQLLREKLVKIEVRHA